MNYKVKLVVALIKNDLRRQHSVSDLAQSVNLSVSRLQHLFKLETGMPPLRYLHLLRIEKARELLESSLMSIKEIRVHVGIYERNHFERTFKKIYGSTPSQYRAAAFSSA